MNSFGWLLAAGTLAGLVCVAALDSTAQAQTGGKTATLKGKVTFDGTPPPPADIKAKFATVPKDAPHCAKGDTEDPTWVVDPASKGVANVVVFLKYATAPKFDAKALSLPPTVDIDQPFCAFKPHVSVICAPAQKLVVKNSAPMLHNTRIEGSRIKNPAKNENLQPGKSVSLTLKSDNQPLKVNCDVHKWMEAYVWSFDHPFAAVTQADGSYEIKGAPAGATKVVVWHEAAKFVNGQDGEAVTLKEGDNTKDYKVKK